MRTAKAVSDYMMQAQQLLSALLLSLGNSTDKPAEPSDDSTHILDAVNDLLCRCVLSPGACSEFTATTTPTPGQDPRSWVAVAFPAPVIWSTSPDRCKASVIAVRRAHPVG